MCFPQCVPGAAGCSIVVQEPSTMHHSFEQICNHKCHDHLNQIDPGWIQTGPFTISTISVYLLQRGADESFSYAKLQSALVLSVIHCTGWQIRIRVIVTRRFVFQTIAFSLAGI